MALTPHEHDIIQKKVDDNICARCRKPIEIGHRILPAYIVCNPNAYNPNKLTERGLELGVDCEFVHVECADPHLTGKVAILRAR